MYGTEKLKVHPALVIIMIDALIWILLAKYRLLGLGTVLFHCTVSKEIKLDGKSNR